MRKLPGESGPEENEDNIDQLLLADIDLRAQSCHTEALINTTEHHLLFQSTELDGIEVDRVVAEPDPLFKRERRDKIDLIADIETIVLISPTDFARREQNYHDFPLPKWLIEVRKVTGVHNQFRLDHPPLDDPSRFNASIPPRDEWVMERVEDEDPWNTREPDDLRHIAILIREYLDHAKPVVQVDRDLPIPTRNGGRNAA